MPSAPPAVDAVTGTLDLAEAPDTRIPVPVAPDHDPSTATRPRRLVDLLRRARRSGGSSYYDPLFGRPDLVEDDYYRFRNQSRGW